MYHCFVNDLPCKVVDTDLIIFVAIFKCFNIRKKRYITTYLNRTQIRENFWLKQRVIFAKVKEMYGGNKWFISFSHIYCLLLIVCYILWVSFQNILYFKVLPTKNESQKLEFIFNLE